VERKEWREDEGNRSELASEKNPAKRAIDAHFRGGDGACRQAHTLPFPPNS